MSSRREPALLIDRAGGLHGERLIRVIDHCDRHPCFRLQLQEHEQSPRRDQVGLVDYEHSGGRRTELDCQNRREAR